ncbi:uncharacterized protein LOC123663051 [Melitaea cinxia]|uniref:uncharacterized protein LOC123663051 n=1 Tax=Melitaea cinxia TaxID=113334 RepID=UPI001E273D3C|nr:uncharacterized protein LOC123663051 [Melitaea cinxia]
MITESGIHVLSAAEKARSNNRGVRGGRVKSWSDRCTSGGVSSLGAFHAGGKDERSCKGCGATEHDYGTCRFRDYVCSKCGQSGHLRRVCLTNSVNRFRRHQHKMDRGDRMIQTRHLGEVAAPTAPEVAAVMADGAQEVEQDVEEDFHYLCLKNYRAVKLLISIENLVINMYKKKSRRWARTVPVFHHARANWT